MSEDVKITENQKISYFLKYFANNSDPERKSYYLDFLSYIFSNYDKCIEVEEKLINAYGKTE